ncbi:hypothetical protein [Streptomyces sp. NPDC054834]
MMSYVSLQVSPAHRRHSVFLGAGTPRRLGDRQGAPPERVVASGPLPPFEEATVPYAVAIGDHVPSLL